jgi:hypothetical protein
MYKGVNGLNVAPNGAMQVETSFRIISENTPLVYQKVSGVTHKVQGRYVIRVSGVFGFAIEWYNPSVPLMIDLG